MTLPSAIGVRSITAMRFASIFSVMRVLVPHLNQRVFEALALGLTALATVKLLVF